MEMYSEYKYSGIPWVGDIPNHWNTKALKRFAKICGGQDQKDVMDADGIYFIYGSGGVFGKASKYLYDKESVLLGRKGTIDKPIYVSEPFWTVDTAFYTEINDVTDPRFFYYLCTTIDFELYKYGSAIPSMSRETLNNIKFACPEKEEQTQLAKYLDHKTAQIDKLISDKEKLIELLNEERTAIINQAVTKGIDPDVLMKDSGVNWLGEVPEHWQVTKLRYLAKSVKTGNTPPSEEPEFYEPGEVDWFTPGDFKSLILNDSKRKIAKKALDEGKCKLFPSRSVLLVGIGATLGKVGVIKTPASSNQQINAITCDESKLEPYFLAHYLSAFIEITISMSSSATLAILNQNQTKELLITVPPLQEQKSILALIHEANERIEGIIKTIIKETHLLKEYKTVLISEVVTGKVDVRDEIVPETKNLTLAS